MYVEDRSFVLFWQHALDEAYVSCLHCVPLKIGCRREDNGTKNRILHLLIIFYIRIPLGLLSLSVEALLPYDSLWSRINLVGL